MVDLRQARALWRSYRGGDPRAIVRLATGSCNYVYRVDDGDATWVLRATDPERRGQLAGSAYWLGALAGQGLPIAAVEHDGLDAATPFLVLGYLPGRDLGAVYADLDAGQKRRLARDLQAVQRRVGALANPGRYGYLSRLDDPAARPDWESVVAAHLRRSRSWIAQCGLFDPGLVDAAEALLPRFRTVLAAVEPRAFLDDATTKNVLVADGGLSGVVDLDWLCFGDRLYAAALTRMALLDAGRDTDYVDFILEEENGAPDRPAGSPVDTALFDFYTLAFCLDFIGGAGMAFNKARPPAVGPAKRRRLLALYGDLLRRLA